MRAMSFPAASQTGDTVRPVDRGVTGPGESHEAGRPDAGRRLLLAQGANDAQVVATHGAPRVWSKGP